MPPEQRRIKHATIRAMPGPWASRVTATLDDGTEVVLFDYYPDEISFAASEFIGLTVAEARSLRHKKDVAYLRS